MSVTLALSWVCPLSPILMEEAIWFCWHLLAMIFIINWSSSLQGESSWTRVCYSEVKVFNQTRVDCVLQFKGKSLSQAEELCSYLLCEWMVVSQSRRLAERFGVSSMLRVFLRFVEVKSQNSKACDVSVFFFYDSLMLPWKMNHGRRNEIPETTNKNDLSTNRGKG